MNKNEVLNFLKKSKYSAVNYSKNDIIALEGSPCERVGLVLKGSVDIKRILTSNNIIHLSSFSEGDFLVKLLLFQILISILLQLYPLHRVLSCL